MSIVISIFIWLLFVLSDLTHTHAQSHRSLLAVALTGTSFQYHLEGDYYPRGRERGGGYRKTQRGRAADKSRVIQYIVTSDYLMSPWRQI